VDAAQQRRGVGRAARAEPRRTGAPQQQPPAAHGPHRIFAAMTGRKLDGEILRLAAPALGALAAEPLYLLVDTAIVGHLGTTQLAALALAASVLSTLTGLCIFLTYGTTAQVARLHGAGEVRRAGQLAAQALWLALAIGVAIALVCIVLGGPLIALLGGDSASAAPAERYLRISALGLPMALIALAGQGHLRGVGDLRTPLVIVAIAQAANAVLEVVFVYGLEWGLDGSATGTVIAQAGMGAAFTLLLLRAGGSGVDRRPAPALIRPLVRISWELFLRSAALLAAFLTASAVLARVGEPSLAAHQVAFGIFIFIALVLDAFAIAAQVLVGRGLGAGDVAGAVAAARRVIVWSVGFSLLVGAILLALRDVLPRAFTDDPAVVDRAAVLWPLFIVMQPLSGIVFALDGILIGAGDTRYLALSMLVAGPLTYVPIALLALAEDWGIRGVWIGLLSLMAVRLVALVVRFRSRRWAVAGVSIS
jgi:putative MATE family efflux protein